ncbi:MAG: acylphosphatase [Dissulfurispiraceae bacterium]
MKARAHIIVDGKVQGVFYRAFTQNVATSLRLTGWVRNLHDGRVEAVFEGERDKIEEAIRKCHAGPPFSRVTAIDVTWGDTLDGFRDFRVEYS